ncbi:MAG TPA: preprotein translocase subunit SecG [Candidatus Tumulicola sp.]
MSSIVLAAVTVANATAHAAAAGAAAKASALPLQAAPPAPLPVMVQTPIAQHAPWLTHGLAGIFIIAAILLIVLLALQTTKQEGLTGSIGGRVESTYRGRLGADEQLKRMTGIVAVVFVVSAFILSLTGI